MTEQNGVERSRTELLPCPFCGGRTLCHPLTMDGRGRDLLRTYWLARCTECGATLPERTDRDEAIAAWNRRADHD